MISQIEQSEATRKIRKAITTLIVSYPFYGCLALKLKLKENPAIDTLCVDGVTLSFNPAYVMSLPYMQLVGAVAHECLHCANGHHCRQGTRDAGDWNAACDYVINPIVLASGLELPEGAYLDAQYDGMSAEAAYSAIQRNKPQQPPEQSPAPQNQQDDSNDPQDGASAGAGQGKTDDSQGDDADADGQEPSQDQSQDGADTNQAPDPGQCGAVAPAPTVDGTAPSLADLQQQEADWRVAAVQAANMAKAAGKLPGSVAEMVEQIKKPRYDGQEIFRELIASLIPTNSTWFPPNKRYVHAGIYLPSLRPDSLGEIVIAIDTSSSLTAPQCSQFERWINGLCEHYAPDLVRVMYCHTQVYRTEEYTAQDYPIKLGTRVGGGTDFRPVFDAANALDTPPSCLVFLTDLDGPAPQHAPDYPVIWVCTDNTKEPWGHVVRLIAE